MPKKDSPHPWQQIEEQAFHAFREWPIWLLLRERELAVRSPQSAARAAATASDRPTSGQSAGN